MPRESGPSLLPSLPPSPIPPPLPLLPSFPSSLIPSLPPSLAPLALTVSPLAAHVCQAPPIYLKLDALQPSGSFKDRGMATLCSTLQRQGARRLVSSSGGNAGLSAALCGRILGMPVQVIVPSTTKPLMLEKIRAQGAKVE